MIRRLIFALLLLAGSLSAQTPTKFASSTGSSSSGCTSGAPGTIAQCNAIAVPGDIIQVNNCSGNSPCYLGTFNISTSGTSSQRITWQAQTALGPKFDGVINISGSFVTWQAMDVTDTATADDGITTIFNSSPPKYGQSVWILGNYIHDIRFSTSPGCIGGNSGILIAAGSGNFIVDSNIILRAGNWGGCSTDGGTSAHGLYISGYHGVVTNNQVSNAAGYGIDLYHNPCENVVANNTVFHNYTGGIQMASPADGIAPCGTTIGSNDFSTVSNNLVIHNAFGTGVGTSHANFGIIFGLSGPGPNNKAFNNLLAGNLTNGGGQLNTVSVSSGVPAPLLSGNIGQTATTGIFVNYQDDGSGDYHLTSGSPARGVGIGGTSPCAISPGISPCIPSADILGISRPTSNAQDIGAYAFTSTGVPLVNFNPSPLGFGTVTVSSSSALTATLSNTGTSNLTFTASISGMNAPDFAITSTTCSSPLAGAARCTYTITFTPSISGAESANLTLNTNAAGSPQQLPLTGTGGTAGVTFNPTSLSFGVVAPSDGGTSCSAIQTFTVTSSGSVALGITQGPTITGANANQFQFGGIGTCPTVGTFAPGASCTYSAKFCPTSSGSQVAQENVFTTAAGSPQNLNITGIGGAPVVSISPSSGSCGSQQIGTSSTCQAFTLTNTGNINLTGITVSVAGTNATSYSQTNNCPATLAAAANCLITAFFKPTAAGTLTANISIVSNAASSPNSAGLTGTGTTPPTVTLSPQTVNFGNVVSGNFSPVTNITLTNTSGAPVTLSSISLTGTNPGDFTAGECSTSATAFTDNFSGGTLNSAIWQIDTGAAPGTIPGVNTGSFSTANVDLSQGVLGLKVTQSGASPVISVGAEIRALNPLGFGTYTWNMRAASTSTSPYGTGSAVSGQISSNFILNSSTANPYTEIDAPEIEGQTPNTLEWTTWTTPSLNTSNSTTLANPQAAFHLYSFHWTAASVPFSVDGSVVVTNSTNIPTAVANPMMNLWGTNSTGFGGLATVGTTRWMYVKGFAFTPAGITSVPAGGTCTIPVFFSPQSTGSKVATLSIADTASGSPHQASLSGNATAPIASLAPASMSFGSQAIGSPTTGQTFTLANSGNAPMSFTIGLTGSNPGDFSVLSTTCITPLQPATNCIISVSFNPTTSGARIANLSIADNASGSPHTSSLSGTGVATSPAVCLSVSSVNFGNQPVNTSSGSKPVTVTNCGTNTLTVASVTPAPGVSLGLDDYTSSDGVTNCNTTQRWCWEHDTGTPGTSTGSSALVTTPTLDGQARSFVTSWTGGGGERYHAYMGPGILDTASTSFVYNTRVYPVDLTHVANLEFDYNQVLANGNTVIYGVQCNMTSALWQYTTNVAGSPTWNNSSATCPRSGWNLNAWNTLSIASHRNAAGTTTFYDSVTLNGVTQTLGTSGNSSFAVGDTPLGAQFVNFQVDGDSTSNSATIYLDEFAPPAGNFSETNNCGSVAPNASCVINGAFSPTQAGTVAGQFAINSNAASSPDLVTLSGFGTQTGATISPTSIAFGSVTVGQVSTSHLATVTNTGNTSVTINTPTITGTNPGDFAFGSSCGSMLAANATCTIGLTFAPTVAGSRSATFNQSFGGGIATAMISLSGTGVATVSGVTFSPTSIDFGNVTTGVTSGIQTAQIQNSGNAVLNISSITLTGTNSADYAITSHCGATVVAGGLCTVDITVTPGGTGARTANLHVVDDAPTSPQDLPLTVNGVAAPTPRVTLNPASLNFSPPSIQTGTTSGAQTITATNTGNANLLVTHPVTLGGTNPGDFIISDNCGTVVPGANCTATINCAPTAAGSRTAVVTFTSNASSSPDTANISCTGFVGTPTLTLAVSMINFGNQTVATTSGPAVFTITNTGQATATGIVITAAGDFAVTDTCGGSLTAGSSCSASVTFTPKVLCGQFSSGGTCTSNVHLGQVSVASNTSNSPQAISLQGTAIPVPPPPGPIVVGMGGVLTMGGKLTAGTQ